MLQDPEYFEDDAIEVAAQDEAEAQRKGNESPLYAVMLKHS